MTTEEHLQKIKAKCECLLEKSEYIPHYSASAEAGWRATIAAIDGWLSLFHDTDAYADGAPDASVYDKLCNEIAAVARVNINHIIAAWPEELL